MEVGILAYRVFIGVGHGGSDSGANQYVKEKDVNLNISLEMQRQLENLGFIVGMSRIKDENDPIAEEIREANAFKPDLAFEVHNNAGRGDGWECYIQTNSYGTKSRAAATAVEKQVKAIGQNSRGIKTKGFAWTSQVKAPAILTEGFFVDNWNDAKDFDTVEEQKKLATAYVKGICDYFGVIYSDNPKPIKPEIPAETTYIVTSSGTKNYASKTEADKVITSLKELCFTGIIDANTKRELKIDDVVRVKRGAKYYNGKTPLDFVYNRDHTVYSISGDRVVIDYKGTIIGPVHKNDLILI